MESNFLEYLFYFNVSFIVRMLLIFSVMMWFYNRVDKDGMLWKIAEWPWKIIAAVFFVADVVYNWYCTVTFLDKPAAWNETVTYRMRRYIKTEKQDTVLSKWRYQFARVICIITSWTDPDHCEVANYFKRQAKL